MLCYFGYVAKINYILGNAVEPTQAGNKIIVHVCNNIGAWGAGFVIAVSRKWPHVKEEYRSLFQNNSNEKPTLGHVQFVVAEKQIVVANMIGQDGIGKRNIPVRYEAIKTGLQEVRLMAEKYNASIHMPRIGCGLAGGTWDKIEPILEQVFDNSPVTIFVYDLKKPTGIKK